MLLGYCVMVKLCCYKWIWIPFIVISVLTIVESKRRQKRAFNLLHHYQQHLISNENHNDLTSNSILYGKKLSSNVNATEKTMTTSMTSFFDIKQSVKEKTLLDLEKPKLFDDIDKHSDLEESSNDTHIRVKRTDFKFVKSDKNQPLIRLKSNYFVDLADSFPRKSSNAEYRSLRKRYIKLSKSSNDYYNTSNYRNVSSNSNGTFFNSQVTETNRYLDNYITDSMEPKIHCNDIEKKVGTIFNLEANISQTLKPNDSMLKNIGVYKKRSEKKRKSDKNKIRRVLHGKKRKLGKHVGRTDKRKGISSKATGKRISNSLKTTSLSKGKQQKIHTIRNLDLPKIVDDYQVESKIKKKDSIDDGSEIDIVRRRKISDYERSSREGENERTEETLIEEKIDVSSVNDNARDKRSLNKSKGIEERDISLRTRLKRNENDNLTIPKYPNVLESTLSSLSMLSETNQSLFEKPRGDRAVKSIEEIKELAEKLVTKVNELQSYLSYENERENKGEKIMKMKKKKLESREIEVPHNNATIEEEVVLETPKLVDECVRIGDLNVALKTLDDRNASFDKVTKKEESGTERMNLLNDRTDSLTKRMIRKNRIKRKSRRKWGRWTGWSSCSVSCGKGRQIRWRHCLRDCSTVETEMEEKACQMPACPPGKFLGIF
ncbi:coiled-coil domain-containing protein 175-like [Vespa crabro]|uniref:coiled-coil domain-containing protein 175-like n=1 Tax=Vespa crabro TaxID=7445 RepID=UPI001F02CE8C|nr:coiled-coil domain-containing protein 175-like [Vespa crabro]